MHMAGRQVNTAEPNRTARAYRFFLAGYLAFVVYGSFVPLTFEHMPFDQAWRTFQNIPYLKLGIASRSDLVANGLLFMPLTFLAMGTVTRQNTRRYRPLAALIVAAGAAGLSVVIEFAQIYSPARTVSLNDIFAECVGALTGVIGWFLVGGRITAWARGLWHEHALPHRAVRILIGYVVALAVYQLLPFDLTISPVEMYHKYKEGQITLIPFTDQTGLTPYMLSVKVAVMIPVGYLFAMLVRKRSSLTAIGLGALAAAGLEGLQLIVFRRYTSATDVILGTIGVAAGVGLTTVLGPVASRPITQTAFWHRHRPLILSAALCLWLGMLMWLKWQPFDVRWPEPNLITHAHNTIEIPFLYQYRKPEFEAISQIVRECVNFLILGILLAGACRRRTAIILTAALACTLEAGQLFLPPTEHLADVTILAIGVIGGILGVYLQPIFIQTFVSSPPLPGQRNHPSPDDLQSPRPE